MKDEITMNELLMNDEQMTNKQRTKNIIGIMKYGLYLDQIIMKYSYYEPQSISGFPYICTNHAALVKLYTSLVLIIVLLLMTEVLDSDCQSVATYGGAKIVIVSLLQPMVVTR